MKRNKGYNIALKKLSEIQKVCLEKKKPYQIFIYSAVEGGLTVDVRRQGGSESYLMPNEEAAFEFVDKVCEPYQEDMESVPVLYDDLDNWED